VERGGEQVAQLADGTGGAGEGTHPSWSQKPGARQIERRGSREKDRKKKLVFERHWKKGIELRTN
jgi:hypothetical protein